MSERRSASTRMASGRLLRLLAILLGLALVAAACGGDDGDDDAGAETEAETETVEEETTTTAAPATEDEDEDEAMEEEEAAMAAASFVSTQFAPVEEAEKLRSILEPGGFDFTGGDEGPTIDQILAGSGSIDVVGALHGTFPPLVDEGTMTNMIDVLDDLSADRTFAPSFVSSGLLGSDDYLAYVPWAQATYIMAAHNDALVYLPEGGDRSGHLVWDELGASGARTFSTVKATPKCGLPHAGLFHRFLEGYLCSRRSPAAWCQRVPLGRRRGRHDDLELATFCGPP